MTPTESVISRTASSRLGWPPRIDAHAVWLWVLCAGLVLYLGIDGGGYDLVVRSDAGVLVWWVLLLGALLGVLPAARLTRTAWAALGLFGAFLVWSAIASSGSLSSERSLQEISRLACYLGVLALALLTYGDRRAALRHVIGAVACAITAIAALALLSRLQPGTFAGSQATATLVPGAQGRLAWPLNYWNALAALVAIGLPLLLGIASSARSLLVQALAAAAIPMLVVCDYLTFSRGGAISVALAVLAFLVLAPERLPKLATALLTGAGGAALIAGAVHRHAIERGLTGPSASHQGSQLIVAIVLVCAGVGLAQAGIGLAVRHGTVPRLLRVSPRQATAMLALVLVIAAIGALGANVPHRLSHAWHDFKQPTSAALHHNALSRYGTLTGNGRYTYWKTAVKAMPGHWLKGYGPGSFQYVWQEHAPILSSIRNAHSLYIETLTETGVVGLGLLVAFLLMLGLGAVHRVLRNRFEVRTQAAAVAAACLAFLVGSAFDWFWQVPVLPVSILLLGAATPPSPATSPSPRTRRPREGRAAGSFRRSPHAC